MPSNICALSGELIKQGAISKKTGHLFQKSSIVKHLSSFPYCPITNQPMTVEDLVFVQGSKEQINRAQESVSTVLNSLKEEYDTLVLERFYLRKNINETKQQLAHSLTANLASEKVIGRLLKEKQDFNKEIEKLRAELA